MTESTSARRGNVALILLRLTLIGMVAVFIAVIGRAVWTAATG